MIAALGHLGLGGLISISAVGITKMVKVWRIEDREAAIRDDSWQSILDIQGDFTTRPKLEVVHSSRGA